MYRSMAAMLMYARRRNTRKISVVVLSGGRAWAEGGWRWGCGWGIEGNQEEDEEVLIHLEDWEELFFKARRE
jgi:hypothetical protein